MLHYKTYTKSQFDKWVVMVHGAGGVTRLIPYSLIEKVIAKCIIPQEKYERSKTLFLRNASKVSFDSFLNSLKLGDWMFIIQGALSYAS